MNRLLSKLHSFVKIVLLVPIFMTLTHRLFSSRLVRVIRNCKQFLKIGNKIPDFYKQSKFRKKSNIAAISTGPDTHLDHLAPLCELMEMPLIVSDHAELAKRFYPHLRIIQKEPAELSLDYLATFDTLYGCGKFWASDLLPLIELLYGKRIRLVFCPHGNSDKEAANPAAAPQDIALAYGQQMHALLKRTGAKIIETGNLRYNYYLAHKTHFDQLAEESCYFNSSKPVALYAPTWDHTSFFSYTDKIIQALKETHHILIKLHPLLLENHPGKAEQIMARYENQIRFITEFPAIFPILERSDLYLGDFSSIGYDFLRYKRPMFFLNEKPSYLERCGQRLLLNDFEKWPSLLRDDQAYLREIKQEVYDFAFRKDIDPERLRGCLRSCSLEI